MKLATNPFIVWLMAQTRLVRYFIIAVLFHIVIILILGSIKIVAILPTIIASFDAAPLPPPLTEPEDPYAVYRDFDYSGPTLGGGGGTPGKGPGGVPTAGGGTPENYTAHILSPAAAQGSPGVADVIGVYSDEAIAIARPVGGPGGVGPAVGLGELKIGTGGIKGPGGTIMGARMGPQRSINLKRYGASEAVEKAVLAGLRWLQKNQQPDGTWSAGNQPAAGTALALLCFLGHGETPDSPEFGLTVNKGLAALVGMVGRDGVVRGGNMYAQGLTVLALAEGFTMTASPALRDPLERAVNALIQSQNVKKKDPLHDGGWRYSMSSIDSDTSVTGWQVMALKSAAYAGIAVPDSVFERAAKYLWNMYGKNGFGYNSPTPSPNMTAVGVLCMQFMGHGNDRRVRAALNYLQEQKVNWQESKGSFLLYGWYYMTQAMFQGGDPYWPYWNRQFRDEIIKAQAEDGHWDAPPNSTEEKFGPVYSTTLCILMLEVYYRYLPMYQILQQQKASPAPETASTMPQSAPSSAAKP